MKKQFYIKGILALFLISFFKCTSVQAQETKFIKRYTVNDGLHHRESKRIIRDTQGKFWIFSDDGAQLYTGSTFKELPELEELPYELIEQIHLLEDGKIYLVANEFYYKIDPINFSAKKFNLDSEHNIHIVNDQIIEYQKGDHQLTIDGKEYAIEAEPIHSILWANMFVYVDSCKILRISDYKTSNYTISNVDDLVGELRGQLLYLKEQSLFALNNQFESKILFPSTSRALVKTDSLGQELLGISNDARFIDSFYLYTADTIIDYSFLLNESKTIRDVYGENFNNDVLLASYEGLIYQSFSENIEHILYNSDNNDEKLVSVIFWVINREKDDKIYFGEERGKIYEYQNSKITQLFPNEKYPELINFNYLASYDKQNDIALISSFGTQPYIRIWDFENNMQTIETGFRTYAFQKLNDHQYLLAGMKKDTAYLSLLDINRSEIIKEISLPELGSRIRNIEINRHSVIVSTDIALFKLDLDEIIAFEGVSSIDRIYEAVFLDHMSFGEYILAGSFGDGLLVFKNDSLFMQLTSAVGLAENIVHTVNFYDGHFWITTLKGISILDQDFNIVKNIRKREGLSSLDFNIQSWATDGEFVFMGTINGLNKINKDIIHENRYLSLVPEQLIYQADNGTVGHTIKNDAFNLPYGIDSCQLGFETYDMFSSYFNNDQIFKIDTEHDGTALRVEKKSIPMSLSSTNSLLSINSSNYSQQKITLLKPSFLKEYLLNISLICLLVLLLYYLYKIRERQFLDKKLQEIKELENKLAAMRSSALRSQMNPHFIFNALGSIQYHIQKEETELAEEYLEEFAFLMRRILESSKEDFVKISEEIDMLKAYVKLEHMRFDHRFDYQFETDSSIELSDQIPSMIIQPFIENAINHGIYHLNERRGNLNIRFSVDSSQMLLCTIEDNGVGRQAAKKLSRHSHRSRSMQIVDERMTVLANKTQQDFSLVIEDKMSNQHSIGTRVKLSFGLN